jgi:hypothetical protein
METVWVKLKQVDGPYIMVLFGTGGVVSFEETENNGSIVYLPCSSSPIAVEDSMYDIVKTLQFVRKTKSPTRNKKRGK